MRLRPGTLFLHPLPGGRLQQGTGFVNRLDAGANPAGGSFSIHCGPKARGPPLRGGSSTPAFSLQPPAFTPQPTAFPFP